MVGIPDPNTPRSSANPGHVESRFLRATHPSRPLAIWVRTTILARKNGEAVAETWFIAFDGERDRAVTQKRTVPYASATFTTDKLHVDALEVTLAPPAGCTAGSARRRFGGRGSLRRRSRCVCTTCGTLTTRPLSSSPTSLQTR